LQAYKQIAFYDPNFGTLQTTIKVSQNGRTVFDLDTNAKLLENNRLYLQTTFGEFKVRPIPWIGHGTKPAEGCPPTWESPLSYPLLLNYCAHTYTPDHGKEDNVVEVISRAIENVTSATQ